MKGKSALLAGAATLVLIITAQSAEAKKKHHAPPPADATASSTTSADPAAPAPHAASNAELESRVKALEDEVEADEAKAQSQGTRLSTIEQGFNDVQWSFDNARPTVKTGDGRFSLALRVRIQADFAGYNGAKAFNNGHDLGSGAAIRRAYFGAEGRAFRDFWYEIRFNAGGSDGGTNGVTDGDAVLNKAVLTYTGIPNFHVNVGVIEPNFMLENTTSSAWLTFLERPEIDNIGADAYGAGDSRRGVEVNWQKTDTLWGGDNLNFTEAFTGGKTGSNIGHNASTAGAGLGTGEQEQLLTRVSDRLWSDGISNLQVGADFSDTLSTGGTGGNTLQLRDRPEIRVDGTRLIDTGALASRHGYMYAFDAGMNFESLFVGGEYAHFEVDRDPSGLHAKDHPQFSGWYAEASYFLTGETRSYSPSALNNEVASWEGPSAVASPFSLDGDSWGTWEVAARYSSTDLNWHPTTLATATTQAGVTGGQENAVDLALNWYLNKDVRLMLDGLLVHAAKRPSAGAAITSQNFSVVGLRLQFAN